MKKLNQTELAVLAKKIQERLHNMVVEAQNQNDKEFDKLNAAAAKAALRQFKKLSPTAKSFLAKCSLRFRDLDSLKEEDILKELRPAQTKIDINYKIHSKILDALILAQITSPDVESLCNAVANQFVKTPLK